MATVGNAAGLLVGLLAALGQAMQQRRLTEQTGQAQQLALLKDSGEFLPATPQESSQAQAGLGMWDRFRGATPPGFFNVGDQLMRFAPAQPLSLDVARPLGLTTQVPREVAGPSPYQTLLQSTAPGTAPFPVPEMGTPAFTQPTTQTVLEEQVAPGLGTFTRKQQQALSLEGAKERFKTTQEERGRIKSLKTTLLNDWKQRGIIIPPEYLQKFLQANTDADLLQVIAKAPTQITVPVTIEGRQLEVPMADYFKAKTEERGQENVRLSNERLAVSLDNLALSRQREARQETQFERGPISPEEAAARRRLGKPLRGLLPPEENAEVGEEMLRFRAESMGRTTAASEEARAPAREARLGIEKEREARLQKQFARGPVTAAERLAREQEGLSVTQPITDPASAERLLTRINTNEGQVALARMAATEDIRVRIAQAGREEMPVSKETTDKLDALLTVRHSIDTIREILGRRGNDPTFATQLKQYTGPWTGFVTQYLSQPFTGGDADENALVTALRNLQSQEIRASAGLAQTGTEVARAIGFFQQRLPTIFLPPDVFASRMQGTDDQVNRQLKLQSVNLRGRALGSYLEDYFKKSATPTTTIIPRRQRREGLRKALEEEP